LKLEGDPDILKMYLHTENEAASLRHLKLRASIEKYYVKVKVRSFKYYRNMSHKLTAGNF